MDPAAVYVAFPTADPDDFVTSLRVNSALADAGGQEATTPTDPAARVVNVAEMPRSESGFGAPWNRPWLSVIDGDSVFQVRATSTTGVEPGSDAMSVTIHCACSPTDGAVVKKLGVEPLLQLSDAPFTWMHIFNAAIGAAATTSAETDPGPSVVKENVRAVPAGSAAESSIMSRNVIVAGEAVPLASAAGDEGSEGVGVVAAAGAPPAADPGGVGDAPVGLAAGLATDVAVLAGRVGPLVKAANANWPVAPTMIARGRPKPRARARQRFE